MAFIDLQRSRVRRSVPIRRCLRDLASLDATLPAGLVGSADRLAFLKAYLAQRGATIGVGPAAAAIRRRSLKVGRRRKIREMLSLSADSNDRIVPVPDGSMHAHQDWLPSLQRLGLDHLAAVMSNRTGRMLRRLPDRENIVLDLPTAAGPARCYLKRHRGLYPVAWLAARLGRRAHLPGLHEAAQIGRLARIGVPTMELIAFGQSIGPAGRGESFVLTREVPHARPLDDLLRSDYTGQLDRRARQRLLQLLVGVSGIVRRLHGTGYSHQDLYCCHFLVRATQPHPGADRGAGGFDIHLIDLQRVHYRRWLLLRWRVKDLAQLNYSAPPEAISRSDRLRFLLHYLGTRRLGRPGRRLVRQVLSKTARIARHDARKRQNPGPDPYPRSLRPVA